MEIIKFRKKNDKQYVVQFSDNTSLNFYDDTIIYFNLLGKKSISPEELMKIVLYDNNYKAYYKALKLVTIKLRLESEIETKLIKDGFTKDNVLFAVSKLKSQGYINREVYLKSYINDQINLSLKGPDKIIRELKKLGFSEEDIFNYLIVKDDVWRDKIKKIIDKKVKSNHNLSLYMLKSKIKNELLQMGYSWKLINEEIENISFQEDKIMESALKKEYRKLSKKYEGDILCTKLKQKMYTKGFSIANIDYLIKNIGEL